MSSFLKNLVARHLDRSNPVRPRLASLYEPPNNAATMHARHDATRPLDSESPAEENRIVERDESRRSVKTSTETHPSLADSLSDEAPMTVWRGQQLAPSPVLTRPLFIQPNEPRAPIAAQPAPPKLQTSPQPPPSPPPAYTQPTNPQLPVAAVAPRTPVLKDEDDISPQVVRQYSNEPTQTVPPIHALTESREQVAAQTAQRQTVVALPVDSTKKGIAVQTRLAVRAESQKGTSGSTSLSHTAAPQMEPTINVTIGRVEVRATLPAPTPRKQASAPQLMGLDEYLRKRARGDDR